MISTSRLKEVRNDKGIKQSEIAEYLGIKKDTYSKYETNGAIPSLETIFYFSKYFQLNIDFVLGLEDKRTNAKYDEYDKFLIANNLKYLRNKNNLTQISLGKKINVTHAAINFYEKGKTNPSLNIVYKYVKLFHITFHDLCAKDFSKEGKF